MRLSQMERLAAGRVALAMRAEHGERFAGLAIDGKPVADIDAAIAEHQENRTYRPSPSDAKIIEFAVRTAKSSARETTAPPPAERRASRWLRAIVGGLSRALRAVVAPIAPYADLDESVRASYRARVELSDGVCIELAGEVFDYQRTLDNLRGSILGKNPALFLASSPATVALAQPVSPGLVALHAFGASLVEAFRGHFHASRAKLRMAGENLIASAASLAPVPGLGMATSGLALISDAQKFRRLIREEMIARQ